MSKRTGRSMRGATHENVVEMPRWREPWSRAMTLPLAAVGCSLCGGVGGIFLPKPNEMKPCGCVLRAVFRACFDRFRALTCEIGQTTLEVVWRGGESRLLWSRKNEEYLADFYLLAKRTLTPGEWRLFRLHFLFGADCQLCCRALKVGRGTLWHEVYRIEEKLGRELAEMRPYRLFPLDEYFGVSAACFAIPRGYKAPPRMIGAPVQGEERKVVPIRPPLRQPGGDEAA